MAAILDANALINLHHAGLLAVVYSRQDCLITAEVYAEVVGQGQRAGHQDAAEIADILGLSPAFPTEILPGLEHFGLGEASVLSQYAARQRGASSDADVIVSDDRQFLNYLRRRNEREGLTILYLTTAGFIASLALEGYLPQTLALESIENIRGRIRAGDYQAARQILETI